MSTPTEEQTDSPRLKPRPRSEPAIDEKVSSVGGLKPELVDVWSQRCAFVVDEILRTERDYVDSLHDIIQGYRGPLVSRLKSSSETQKLVNSLFGNVDELHGLHLSLLKKLQAYDTEPHEFGQVFIQTEDGFQLYTGYCTNYNSAMLCLQQLLLSEKHNQFLDQCQRSLRHTLPLSAQLIKPVQRITRYHLLLHDLVKHFNPNHYGYPSIKQAQKTMARIANHINKVKKQEENAKRVEDLKTSLYGWKGNEGDDNLSVYGELLLESTCYVGPKKGIERQVLLFEKLLLILKKKDAKRYNYKAHILASELCLDDKAPPTNQTSFKVFSKNRRHIIYTVDPRSNSKRTEWINAISDLTRRMAEQFPQNLEEEYGQFIKRQKLDELVSENQRSPVPQRIESPVRVLMERTNTELHGRIPSLRKRRRPDVREVFGQEEAGVQLLNVRRAVTSESTYQVPQPAPTTTPELAGDEEMEEPSSQGVLLGKRAESVESLLSLSDVEVGMEEHAGALEEVDHQRRKIKRRKTDLRRRQAIMVKRSPSASRALESSISTRIKMKAREAKQDVEGDKEFTDGRDSASDEESELARLVAPSQPMDSSMEQDSLCDSSMDSSALGQSIGGGGAMGVVSGVGGAVGVALQETPPAQVSDTGPPIEIIADYKVEEGQEEEVIDDAFAMVIEDAGIGDSPIPEGASLMIDSEKRGDIFIVDDSSTDSEDEEDESVVNSSSVDIDDIATIPPPLDFAGDQEVPSGELDRDKEEQLQGKSKDELGEFFKTLNHTATPDDKHADVSTTEHSGEGRETPCEVQQPYVFTGSRGDIVASPAPLDRVREAEIYATMPRNKKPHSKNGLPLSASPCTTPLGHHAAGSKRPSQSTSAQPHSRSAARRAEGFSELLQFTREQQFCSPLGDMDVSQSLPSFMSSVSGQSLQERVAPAVGDLMESSVDENVHEAGTSDSIISRVSNLEDVSGNGGHVEDKLPDFAISVSPRSGEELVGDDETKTTAEIKIADPINLDHDTSSDLIIPQVSDRQDNISGPIGVPVDGIGPDTTSFPPLDDSSKEEDFKEERRGGTKLTSDVTNLEEFVEDRAVCGDADVRLLDSSVDSEQTALEASGVLGDSTIPLTDIAIAPPPNDSKEELEPKEEMGPAITDTLEEDRSICDDANVKPHDSSVDSEDGTRSLTDISSPRNDGKEQLEPMEEKSKLISDDADIKPHDSSVDSEEGTRLLTDISPPQNDGKEEFEPMEKSKLISDDADIKPHDSSVDSGDGTCLFTDISPPLDNREGKLEPKEERSKLISDTVEEDRSICDDADVKPHDSSVDSGDGTCLFTEISPPLDGKELEPKEEKSKLISDDAADVKPLDSSVDSDQSTGTELSDTSTFSDDSLPEPDRLQRNGSHYLRQRTDQSEHKDDSIKMSASNDSSDEQDGTVVQTAPVDSGVFGWVRRSLRRGVWAFLPPLGLRSGLVAVGVAAVSSFVIYAMTAGSNSGATFLSSSHVTGSN